MAENQKKEAAKRKILKLFEPIAQTVQIAQKTIKDTPTEKRYDTLISMLANPTLHHYSMVRIVRDVFHISGFLLTDAFEQVA